MVLWPVATPLSNKLYPARISVFASFIQLTAQIQPLHTTTGFRNMIISLVLNSYLDELWDSEMQIQ